MTGPHSAGEPAALARLVTRGVGALTARIEELHDGIAERAFRASGPGAVPVHVTHDAIAGAVYASVRGVSTAVGAVSGAALAAYPWPEGGRVVSRTRAGAFTLGALNGFLGDRLDEEGDALSVPLTVRVGARDVPAEPASLAAAFPEATGKLTVFVHGLCENEESWRWGAERHCGDREVTYGSQLAADFGHTPVYLRYNTGLHISENGRRLAALLEDVVAGWPVEVTQISLVGHSMGGLVVRSACHAGERSGLRWPSLVRHVVSLGTPHLGAPLEQVVNVASWLLRKLPETRPVSTVLDVRSVGIKDLRFGYLCDEDWTDRDCAAPFANYRSDVPLLGHAAHYHVGATLTRDARHPLGRVLGDLLVLTPSASGRSRGVRRIPFEVGNGRHFGGMHHFTLLNHPDVYDQLARWLGGSPRSEVSVLPPQTMTATCSPGAGE
jgi:pimeloyl-ACP methyl ester carboxylesterase